MAVQGSAALAGWFDYQGDQDMNEWQAREHVYERIYLPGFIRLRRFSSPSASPRNFTFCEAADLSAMSSPEYLERLNRPTEWSRKCSTGLYNMRRSICRIAATVGDVDGGTVATLEVEAADPAALQSWLAGKALPGAVEAPGVYSAHLLVSDDRISRIETEEKRLRRAPDTIVGCAVVLEGLDPESVIGASGRLLSREELIANGASSVSPAQVYRLAFSAARHDGAAAVRRGEMAP